MFKLTTMDNERKEVTRWRKRHVFLLTACFATAATCLLFLLVCCNNSKKEKAATIQELSNKFPSLQDSIEMARLSGLVYAFKHYDDCNATSPTTGKPLLPSDLDCHLYHHDRKQGTQVMILSSRKKQYIALVFAGTDDLRTTLTDTDILLKPFGPLDKDGESILLPGPARVHAGFDNAVFQHDLFETLYNITTTLLTQEPNYRLFSTGHSLGGADAILTAVALTQSTKNMTRKITCINFGCPNIGNEEWRNAIHNLLLSGDKLAIWRFVHGWDVVPRLPQYPFVHVGHTLQMNVDGMHAYYLHRGNSSLNYASVPLGWGAKPFIFLPVSLWSHVIRKYQEYLRNVSAVDPSHYYVSAFEPLNSTSPNNNDDGMMMDDDAWINPPDDIWFDIVEKEEMVEEVLVDIVEEEDDDDDVVQDEKEDNQDEDVVVLEWNDEVVEVEEEEYLDVQ